MTRAGTYEPRYRQVACPKCGYVFHVTGRQARKIEIGEHSGLCEECRRVAVRVEVTDSLRNYWLSRFTIEEIKEMGAALEMLLNDHSRFAHDPAAKGANWAA